MQEHKDPTFQKHLNALRNILMSQSSEASGKRSRSSDDEQETRAHSEEEEEEEEGTEESDDGNTLVYSSDSESENREIKRRKTKAELKNTLSKKKDGPAKKSEQKRSVDSKEFEEAEDYTVDFYHQVFDASKQVEETAEGATAFRERVEAVLKRLKKLNTDPKSNLYELVRLCVHSNSMEVVRGREKHSVAVFKKKGKEVRYSVPTDTARFVAAIFYVAHIDSYLLHKIKEYCKDGLVDKKMPKKTVLSLFECDNRGFHRGLTQKILTQVAVLEKDLECMENAENSAPSNAETSESE